MKKTSLLLIALGLCCLPILFFDPDPSSRDDPLIANRQVSRSDEPDAKPVHEIIESPETQNREMATRTIPESKGGKPARHEANEKTRLGQPAVLQFDWKYIDDKLDANFEDAQEKAVAADADDRRVIDGAEFAKQLSERKRIEIPDGATFSFGPGIFDLTAMFTLGNVMKLPPDVRFKGAGMDATLLVFGYGVFSKFKKVNRLKLEDLTLDAGDHAPFSMRGEKVGIDLDRVRVVRFDNGRGGSALFRLYADYGECVIRACDSEFIGGYGEGRGVGNLFRCEHLLASFTGCKFELIDILDKKRVKGWQIFFKGCEFVLLREDPTCEKTGAIVFEDSVLKSVLPANDTIDDHRKDYEAFKKRFSDAE